MTGLVRALRAASLVLLAGTLLAAPAAAKKKKPEPPKGSAAGQDTSEVSAGAVAAAGLGFSFSFFFASAGPPARISPTAASRSTGRMRTRGPGRTTAGGSLMPAPPRP